MRRLAETGPGLDDHALRAALAAPTAEDTGPGPWVRVVFIASADGAATLDGRAGGLGSPADQRLLSLSRHDADVVLVGAGTIRAEGYEGALLSEEDRRRRAEAGGPADPPVAVVSGSLDLDPESAFFTAAPVRPWILTSRAALAAEPERATALAARADVLAVGQEHVDPQPWWGPCTRAAPASSTARADRACSAASRRPASWTRCSSPWRRCWPDPLPAAS